MLTEDNGKEFAHHEKMIDTLDAKVYFADSYCSWQRGLNENANGLLRQYWPKATDFKKASQKEYQMKYRLLKVALTSVVLVVSSFANSTLLTTNNYELDTMTRNVMKGSVELPHRTETLDTADGTLSVLVSSGWVLATNEQVASLDNDFDLNITINHNGVAVSEISYNDPTTDEREAESIQRLFGSVVIMDTSVLGDGAVAQYNGSVKGRRFQRERPVYDALDMIRNPSRSFGKGGDLANDLELYLQLEIGVEIMDDDDSEGWLWEWFAWLDSLYTRFL